MRPADVAGLALAFVIGENVVSLQFLDRLERFVGGPACRNRRLDQHGFHLLLKFRIQGLQRLLHGQDVLISRSGGAMGQ